LREIYYDWAIDLHGVTDSALVTLAARAAHRAGPRLQLLSLFMKKRTGGRGPEPIHEAWRALLALAACGLLETADLPLLPKPEYHSVDGAGAAGYLAACGLAGQPFLALFPGASQAWKTWPVERFAALATRLGERFRLPLVLLGGAGDTEAVTALRGHLNGAPATALGLPLPLVAGIIAQATLLIGNDTGPLHLAGALGVPTVAVYGPVDFLRFHPLSDRAWPVVPDAPCLPCTPQRARRCRERVCLVETDAVLAACREALGSIAPQLVCACCGQGCGKTGSPSIEM
jgi:ADP-heptose:LPS heptosyltransferase